MKLALPWKVAAALAMAFVLVVAIAVTLVYQSRPQPLTLAGTRPRSPVPTSDAGDPLAAVGRRPAVPAASTAGDLSGLWLTQAGSVVGYRAHESFLARNLGRVSRVQHWND